jgi:sulfoxide reductase heme-binding subunit YedZ
VGPGLSGAGAGLAALAQTLLPPPPPKIPHKKNTKTPKNKKPPFLTVVLFFLFWEAHFQWTFDLRLWRAIGDASYALLAITLVIGPLSKIWNPAKKIIPWRREFGIWFAILAITHGILVADGWLRWDIMKFFGYEFINELDRYARIEPGFGLSNLIGLVAFGWSIILMITSSDKATKYLGASSWKWLHSGSYVVFYLVAIHTAYFIFIHYTESFHRMPAPQSMFIIYFVIMTITVISLQILAFIKTIKKNAKKNVS